MDNVEVNGLRVAYRPAGRGPTLVLYGDADRRSPPEAVAAELHRRIPGSRLAVLPGVGHAANMEAPDRFNAEVREFLRSVP
jgi:pimeloyl-ACP methyl ester carboxylesterase